MMKLNVKTQERVLAISNVKVSTIQCSKRNSSSCPFYLERTDSNKNEYKLVSYWNTHNHGLNKFLPANVMTPEILKSIKDLRGFSKDNTALTKALNKKHKTNFHPQTVYYQVKKIKNCEYGTLSLKILII